MTKDEALVELDLIRSQVLAAHKRAHSLSISGVPMHNPAARALSVAKTKLDEARLWVTEAECFLTEQE